MCARLTRNRPEMEHRRTFTTENNKSVYFIKLHEVLLCFEYIYHACFYFQAQVQNPRDVQTNVHQDQDDITKIIKLALSIIFDVVMSGIFPPCYNHAKFLK